MRAMSLEAVNEIVGASQHLPGGASLVFHRVDWDDYEGVPWSTVRPKDKLQLARHFAAR